MPNKIIEAGGKPTGLFIVIENNKLVKRSRFFSVKGTVLLTPELIQLALGKQVY